jgi:hypothetical protein
MRSRILLALVCRVLVAGERPTFRTGARLVELRVVVTGKENAPVTTVVLVLPVA